MVIAFEGIDGCGKDTQIKLLSEYLTSKNIKNIIVNSCSSWILSKIIRDKLKCSINKKQMAGLFIAELHEHTDHIKEAIKEGNVILLNRWIYSTMAYNSTSIKEMDAIRILSNTDITVDHVIYLDVPLQVALDRVSVRSEDKDVYENRENLTEVISYYNYMKKQLRFTVVDGNRDKDLVAKDIRKFLEF